MTSHQPAKQHTTRYTGQSQHHTASNGAANMTGMSPRLLDGSPMSPQHIMQLQKALGNSAVSQLLKTRDPVQRQADEPEQPVPDIQDAANAGFSGKQELPIQAKWISVQVPDDNGDTGWYYRPISRIYSNYFTGEDYDPKHRILDNRNEPLSLRELDEEEHEDMMDEILVARKEAFMEEDSLALYFPDEQIRSFMDSPEIRVPVGIREHYHTILEISRDGIDLQHLIEMTDEKRSIPPRQITKGAQTGFEFQQLGSKVEVYEKPQEEENSGEDDDDDIFVFDDGGETQREYDEMSQSDNKITLKTKCFGRDKLWYVVADGSNLEFVTLPFSTLDDLEKGIGELQSIATIFAGSDAGSVYQLEDTIVKIIKPDNKAQPQVNADIPLDAVHNVIEDVSGNPDMREDLFGVDTAYWRADDTDEELDMIAEATKAIRGLSIEEIRNTFRITDFDGLLAKIGSIKGMLEILAQAVIHKLYFSTSLAKDQPVLLKTHMGKLWLSLVDDGVIGDDVSLKAVAALLVNTYKPLGEKKSGILIEVLKQVSNGVDPVWSSSQEPVDIPLEDDELEDDEREDQSSHRKQVLIELRRVPVLPIDEWLGFAVQAHRYFVEE